MARPRVGIKQVAEAAGVSPTTVSHALNGKGRLAEETRERIRRVADDLGYRPSAIARNLVDGRTGVLGLVMPSARELVFPAGDVAYFMQLTSAATSVAMEQGYALVVTSTNEDGSSPFTRVDVDGAIVVDPVSRDTLVAELRTAAVPVVTTGRVLGDEDAAPWVDNDHAASTRAVLEHLVQRGAHRPALITSQPDTSYASDVEEAYRAWCGERDIEPLVVRARPEISQDAAAEAAREVLDLMPTCDAVFATLDRLGLATMHEARSRGIAVPAELLVVGATDSEAARWAVPSLTVLNLQPDVIGRRAAEALIAMVRGTAPRRRHAIVPAKLVARESTRRRAPRRARSAR